MDIYLSKKSFRRIDRLNATFRRQFSPAATRWQKVFDWTMGIVLPLVCVMADPIVFSGHRALLGPMKPFAYLLSFFSILALMAFLIFGEKLGRLNGFLSGFFALGSVISLLVGIVIFPFSVIGLVVVIGVLGFTPLLAAFVYLRNSIRAFSYARLRFSKVVLIHTFAISAIFGFVLPYIANVQIQKGLRSIETGDVSTIKRTSNRLWYVSPILNPESVQNAYFREYNDADRRAALKNSYLQLSEKHPVKVLLGLGGD